MRQPREERELWRGLGRKKKSSRSFPKVDPSQPPEKVGRKNEIISIKYSAFREEGLLVDCKHARPSPEDWAVHRFRNQGLGGPLWPSNNR